jgi:8-oxo-dGTP pyrophosphatase MutT (NUDIX family)
MISMGIYTTLEILRSLRERLLPVGQADEQSAAVQERHAGVRRAAVLVPLFDKEGEACLAFIRRASTLRAHSGEIAFPGGGADPIDPSMMMTALREAQEEIGLDPSRVEVLGALAPVFTSVSNYLITPVVAFLPLGLGPLRLQASEVTEVIVAPLRALADPAIARTERWTRGGQPHIVHFYDYGPYCIWGATGRMLNALLAALDADEAPKG